MNEYIHAELLLIIVMCRCALSGAFLNYQQCFQNTIMNELVRAVARLSREARQVKARASRRVWGIFPRKIVKCNSSEMLLLALLYLHISIYFLKKKKTALFKCKW